MTYFNTASHFMAFSVITKLGLEILGCFSMYLICLFILIILMCYTTFFNTASHFMAMFVATKINFLRLENFCMLFFASTLPFHTDRFDVLHHPLQHCFTLHGHVRDYQDQLLGVRELLYAAHCIYFAFTY